MLLIFFFSYKNWDGDVIVIIESIGPFDWSKSQLYGLHLNLLVLFVETNEVNQ